MAAKSVTKFDKGTPLANLLNPLWLYTLAILITAIFLRLFELSFRPFHNDEGVNYYFLTQILEKGYYPYSHENYHGPSYFYLLFLCYRLFGDSEWAIRLSAVLPGIITLLILLKLKPFLGGRYVLSSMLLLTLSSSLVFYSRYAIHETLYLLFTLWLALGIYLYAETEKRAYLFWIMPAIAALIATKETFIIVLACLGLATILLRSPVQEFQILKRHYQSLLWSLLIAALIVIAFFSGAFQWFGGLHEMFRAVPQWLSRNESDTGHFKEFLYYFKVFFQAEPTALACLAAALIYWLVKSIKEGAGWITYREQRYFRFILIWGVSIALVYSLVNYKTTWLIINLTLPFLLLGAYVISRLPEIWFRSVLTVFALISLGYTLYFNYPIKEIHAQPYGADNPYSYVHTSPGMRELLADIERYYQSSPNARILIGVSQYWPLPYYLRAHVSQLAYLKTSDVGSYSYQYQIIIVEKDVNWSMRGWVRKYYRLSEVQESYAYFKVQ